MNKIPLFPPFSTINEGLAEVLAKALKIKDLSLRAELITTLGCLENTINKSGTAGQNQGGQS
jgi:hypothetical protein